METLKKLVIDGKEKETASRILLLIEEGRDPEVIMQEALIPAMDEVGRLFQEGEFFLPEMLIAARAMQRSLDVLKPRLTEGRIKTLGKVVIGTVKGDLHDIGKNLVGIALQGSGFEVIDLGYDVSPEKFVGAIADHKPMIIGMSAMITTTMLAMGETIEEIRKRGMADGVKVMIGGAPVTQEYANQIGADFYGRDSISAKDFARSLILKKT
jgi:5-methyltetrahydrofolate--homocysteine methyltransferase